MPTTRWIEPRPRSLHYSLTEYQSGLGIPRCVCWRCVRACEPGVMVRALEDLEERAEELRVELRRRG